MIYKVDYVDEYDQELVRHFADCDDAVEALVAAFDILPQHDGLVHDLARAVQPYLPNLSAATRILIESFEDTNALTCAATVQAQPFDLEELDVRFPTTKRRDLLAMTTDEAYLWVREQAVRVPVLVKVLTEAHEQAARRVKEIAASVRFKDAGSDQPSKCR